MRNYLRGFNGNSRHWRRNRSVRFGDGERDRSETYRLLVNFLAMFSNGSDRTMSRKSPMKN